MAIEFYNPNPNGGGSSTPTSGWIPVGSQDIAVSFATFSSLAVDTYYKMIFRLSPTVTGNVLLRFNGDSGANYRWAVRLNQDNGDTSQFVDQSDNELEISGDNNVDGPGFLIGEIQFNSMPGDSTTVMTKHQLAFMRSTFYCEVHGGGKYDGATPLTSVTLSNGGGPMVGNVTLMKWVP